MAKREIIVEWNQKWWENIISRYMSVVDKGIKLNDAPNITIELKRDIRYMIVEYLKRDGFVFTIDAQVDKQKAEKTFPKIMLDCNINVLGYFLEQKRDDDDEHITTLMKMTRILINEYCPNFYED